MAITLSGGWQMMAITLSGGWQTRRSGTTLETESYR
jgi:hypothetical protein